MINESAAQRRRDQRAQSVVAVAAAAVAAAAATQQDDWLGFSSTFAWPKRVRYRPGQPLLGAGRARIKFTSSTLVHIKKYEKQNFRFHSNNPTNANHIRQKFFRTTIRIHLNNFETDLLSVADQGLRLEPSFREPAAHHSR